MPRADATGRASRALGLDLTRRFGDGSVDGRPRAERSPSPGLTDELVRRTARHPRRRRGLGDRPVVPRDGGRVRRGARAVRRKIGQLPGDQAPVRGDAGDGRVRHRRGVGRRLGRLHATTSSGRSPPTWPAPSPSTARSATPRPASRCSAASASRSSTTRTSTCAGRPPCAACSASPDAFAGVAGRAGDGRERRRVEVDLGGRDDAVRADVRRVVAAIAALPGRPAASRPGRRPAT